jgi:hypothetical protein
MSTRAVMFLLTLAVGVLFAVITAALAAGLAYLSGAHPATALARGGVAFGAALTLVAGLVGLAYAVLHT